MPLAYFVDQFSPYLGPHWGRLGLRYYGLAYALGFLCGAWLLIYYAQRGRSRLPAAMVADFMVVLAIGVLAGGRIGYLLLYSPAVLFQHPLVVFQVWDGGMASHGGMVGVVLAIAWFARKHKLSFYHLGDLVVSVTPIGLFFGRLANFINGELWGKVSSVPWAVIFPRSAEGTPLALIPPRHPSQLYEAALEGLLLFAYLQWRFWKTAVVQTRPGRLGGEFFCVYAVVRVVCEVFREPDEGVSLILGLSRGTFYSLLIFLGGLFLILRARREPSSSVRA
jgi:phosphatidylglycerol:prolipoprotein diacylglycerol transferase